MYLSLPLPTATELCVPIQLIPLRHNPIKYCVKIPKKSKITQLKSNLSNLCSIAESKLIIVDTRQQLSILDDSKVMSTVLCDSIYAYEVCSTYSSLYYIKCTDTVTIPYPIIISLPQEVTGNNLYEEVLQQISQFIITPKDEFPFRLKYGKLHTACIKCLSSNCSGCIINQDDQLLSIKTSYQLITLIIEWTKKCDFKDPIIQYHESWQPVKSDSITLDDCFKSFLETEQLSSNDEWYCPKCKTFQQAMKKFDLWNIPQVLVVHLKRFSYTKWSREKLSTLVEFPIEGLNLSRFVLQQLEKPLIYDLFAVSNHSGGLTGGHYTAYAKNRYDQQWYLFNDSSSSHVQNVNQIITSGAYLLLYKKRNDSE